MDIDQIFAQVASNPDTMAELNSLLDDLESWGNIGGEEQDELDLPGAVEGRQQEQQADGGDGVAGNSCAAEAGGVRALGHNRGGHDDDDDDRDEPIPSPQPQPQEEEEDESAGENGAVLMRADNVVVPSASSKKSENRIKNKKK